MGKSHIVQDWVNATNDPVHKEFRQAVHTFFVAIAGSDSLSQSMILKGGILHALRFQSTRNTKDVDFSSGTVFEEFNEHDFLMELDSRLRSAVQRLNYNLDCRVQSHKWVNPSHPNPTRAGLKIRIGHAYFNTKQHDRLKRKCCTSVLPIDFSFNETNIELDVLEIVKGQVIRCYSLADSIAEKMRAMIQQVDRGRTRRQDAFDIFVALKSGCFAGEEIKDKILKSLIIKSQTRNICVHKMLLRDDEIRRRSQKDYPSLADDIQMALPPFDEVYDAVCDFYESLPWDTLS